MYHPVFMEHDAGPKHPERPARLKAILDRLEASGLMDRLVRMEPAEADVSLVTLVHAPEYVAHLAGQSALGKRFHVDADTFGGPATYRAALTAVGAMQKAADAVMAGQIDNAFCAVRPPGHHAERDHAMGFCFFNNVAICARYLQARHGIKRVAIVDWDAHHGNGTQNIFYHDPSVFYFSAHQYPHYPGTGRSAETGSGHAEGTILNAPMAAGSTDSDFTREFNHSLKPALDSFKPEFILVSAGFDGHSDDPLSALLLTADGFAEMTRTVLASAHKHCHGRLISVLEGGYELKALADSVEKHLEVLIGKGPGPTTPATAEE